jgi:hypothetical protein
MFGTFLGGMYNVPIIPLLKNFLLFEIKLKSLVISEYIVLSPVIQLYAWN